MRLATRVGAVVEAGGRVDGSTGSGSGEGGAKAAINSGLKSTGGESCNARTLIGGVGTFDGSKSDSMMFVGVGGLTETPFAPGCA